MPFSDANLFAKTLKLSTHKLATKADSHFFLRVSKQYKCPYCGKQCKTQRGVTQHINQSPTCLSIQELQISGRKRSNHEPEEVDGLGIDDDDLSVEAPRRSSRLQGRKDRKAPSGSAVPLVAAMPANNNESDSDDAFPAGSDTESVPKRPTKNYKKMVEDTTMEADDTSTGTDTSEGDTSNPEAKAAKKQPPPNTKLLQDFKTYCDTHYDNFLQLSKAQKTCIRLMQVLKKRAPLTAYEEVLEWHLKESGKLHWHEPLGALEEYQRRETLISNLIKRYNLTPLQTTMKKVRLPSAKAVVGVPCRDAGACIVSLLTDPRIKDEDYLFFDDDPLARPPKKVTKLGDLNTGDAYLKTHAALIKKPNQVLLPICVYIDGAITGQFSDLPATPVKIALGIHKRETRDKSYAWREIGFVPVVRKDPSRGKKIFEETGHLDTFDLDRLDGEGDTSSESDSEDEERQATDDAEREANEDNEEREAVKAQDFHTILSSILESFVELQETGFVWDFVYKGKVYEALEFIIFVIFVKCDTEEGDLLCGKYTVRTQNVKHVCRYCHCPTEKADDPRASFRPKTQAEIQKLVDRGKLDKLKAISQQYIKNAWYDVRFHQANEMGIHGACPSEKLHAIQLGLFKYVRTIFFKHMGEHSQLANDINGIATMYGKLMTRQSEKDLPATNFSKGIQKGRLMGREFRGVLLIMAAVLRSTGGYERLYRKRTFGKETGLRDWQLLVELLLEWEAYLCEKQMNRSHIMRLGKKHRFILYIIRNVARRSTGMGLKVMKFHAVTHMIQDILLYGVPTEFDTGSNESHHKDAKFAAKLTQRKESTFNQQTATRLTEFHCIELGTQEIISQKTPWEYFDGAVPVMDWDESDVENKQQGANQEPSETDVDGELTEMGHTRLRIRTGGTRFQVFEDPDQPGKPAFKVLSSSKSVRRTSLIAQLVDFLYELQQLVGHYLTEPYLPILSEHKRGDQIFRGHPNFRSKPWRDWVMVDWGAHGHLPSRIWCFVQLSNMPTGRNRLQFGGVTLGDDVYAVVEVAEYDEDPEAKTKSDLLVPLVLEMGDVVDEQQMRQFYLASTEAFAGPCCVIPDIGGDINAYFQVKRRSEWAKEFISWLEAPHQDDVTEYSDEEKQPK